MTPANLLSSRAALDPSRLSSAAAARSLPLPRFISSSAQGRPFTQHFFALNLRLDRGKYALLIGGVNDKTDELRLNRGGVNRLWALGVLCTSTLYKRGGGVNRLWALGVLCTSTLYKRGGVNRGPIHTTNV